MINNNPHNNPENRGQWSSKLGFILAAAGSAVGLGNLWKFPYLVGKNGGAAFLLVYILIVIGLGFTLMLGELVLGRKTQLNPLGAYRSINKKWGFAGGLGIVTSFIILSYYSVIGGWILAYIIRSLTGAFSGDTVAIFEELIAGVQEPLFMHFLFLFATVLIVYAGVSGGIEKYSKILMPTLFGFLIILSIRGITLPGASKGLEFYLKPDFTQLTTTAILAALGQVFFSLSLGMGAMITYGSYLPKDTNLPKSSVIIPLIDSFIAFLSGLVVLPAVFALGFEAGEGPGLMFITLPAVFAKMPFGIFFGSIFFILVLFAALTSSISLLEVCVSYVVDELKIRRRYACIILGILLFLVGVPSSLSLGLLKGVKIFGMVFFDLADFIASTILMPIGGLLLCIFIGWIWGSKKALKEVTNNGEIKFAASSLWEIAIKYVVPIIIIIVFFTTLTNS